MDSITTRRVAVAQAVHHGAWFRATLLRVNHSLVQVVLSPILQRELPRYWRQITAALLPVQTGQHQLATLQKAKQELANVPALQPLVLTPAAHFAARIHHTTIQIQADHIITKKVVVGPLVHRSVVCPATSIRQRAVRCGESRRTNLTDGSSEKYVAPFFESCMWSFREVFSWWSRFW
jgi:hypothetical protein